jgi:hypothetical protein
MTLSTPRSTFLMVVGLSSHFEQHRQTRQMGQGGTVAVRFATGDGKSYIRVSRDSRKWDKKGGILTEEGAGRFRPTGEGEADSDEATDRETATAAP